MADPTLSGALADPVTRARVDSLLEDFRRRGVVATPLNVIAFATDCGLSSDAAALLAQAVETRLVQIKEEATCH